MTSFVEQMSVFPTSRSGLALSFAEDAPVLIDGMRVVFDQKIALFPIELKPEDRPEERP